MKWNMLEILCLYQYTESHSKIFWSIVSYMIHFHLSLMGQVLSIMEAKAPHTPPLECIRLTLDTCIRKSVHPGIANLLENSPQLEKLVITECSSCYIEVRFRVITYNYIFSFNYQFTSCLNRRFCQQDIWSFFRLFDDFSRFYLMVLLEFFGAPFCKAEMDVPLLKIGSDFVKIAFPLVLIFHERKWTFFSPEVVLMLTQNALLHLTYFQENVADFCAFDEKQYWTSQKRTFACLTQHLREVKLASNLHY